MNSTPTIQLAPTELPSVTPIGNLLSNLDEVTRARVLEEPCMRYPLVLATKPYAKKIQEALMKCSYFDANLGRFIRITCGRGNAKCGLMGFIRNDGYVRIKIENTPFQQSHLVCLWLTGDFPRIGHEIDHFDGNRHNDCPNNLRLIPIILNKRNKKMSHNNTSGCTGATWDNRCGKWQTYLGKKYIGLFNTIEEAYTARQNYIIAHPELGFTSRHGT